VRCGFSDDEVFGTVCAQSPLLFLRLCGDFLPSADRSLKATLLMTVPLPSGLPVEARISQIAFVPVAAEAAGVLLTFPATVGMQAVQLTPVAPQGAETLTTAPISLLSVPVVQPEEATIETARVWVGQQQSQNKSEETSPPQLLLFHGAVLLWGRGAAAILAPAERLTQIEQAYVEIAYFEQELYAIETQLGRDWSALEQDIPAAFEFNERTLPRKQQLLQRFQQVVQLQARFARLMPFLLAPHQYPPTIASQVGERIRERMRVEYRIEWVTSQLEVYRQVYEMCGERSSNFVHARSSNTLEWVIILLLVIQVLMMFFDYLSAAAV